MLQGNKRDRLERIIRTLLIVLTAVACVPFLCAARYTVFCGDDFAFYNGSLAEPIKNLFVFSLKQGYETYMTWQGTYLTNILNRLLNPLHTYSYSMLRLLMMGCVTMAVLSTALLCREADRLFSLGGRWGCLFAAILLPLFSFREYEEVYLWFVGAMAYLVPTVFLILGAALTLRGERRASWLSIAAACISMLLMAGGVLLIGGFAACMTLLLLLVDALERRRFSPRYLAVFLAVLAGDLINTLAPGNFAKNAETGGFHLGKAVTQSFAAVLQEYAFFLSHGLMLLALLIMLAVGWKCAGKLRWISFSLALIGLVLTPVVTAFPFMLGYAISDLGLLSSRFYFVVDMALVVCMDVAAILLGGQLHAVISKPLKRAVPYLFGLLSAAALILSLAFAHESVPVQISRNLAEGKIQAFGAGWHEIYERLRACPGEDVVIYEQPDRCMGCNNMFFRAFPDNWVNASAARYFGNNRIYDGWYEYVNGLNRTEGEAG